MTEPTEATEATAPEKLPRYILTTVLDFPERVEGKVLNRSDDREVLEKEMEATDGVYTSGARPISAFLEIIDTEDPKGGPFSRMTKGSQWRQRK